MFWWGLACYRVRKMGKTRKGLRYKPQDEYYKIAQKDGFVARSALKLQSIDERWKIYKRGIKVLDLGCAPGSWLQYASKKVGKKGHLVGIDIEEVRVDLPNVETHILSLYDLKPGAAPLKEFVPFDVMQSDAMVKTIGVADSDVARSIALVEASLKLAEEGALRYGGTFIAKVFDGPGFTEFYSEFKKKFRKQYVAKPKAVRKGSREVYLVGLEFKGLKKKAIQKESQQANQPQPQDPEDS